MEAVSLAARLLLVVVFAVAGTAKLADLEGSRAAARGFGLPAWLAAPVGHVLPIAELATAIALLPETSARVAAVASLVLLGAFVAAIALNLARGRTPDCHCFGQLHSSPAGWQTLGRNAGLGVAAGFVVVRPGPSATAWVGELSTVEAVVLAGGLVAVALFASNTFLVIELMKQNGRLLRRLEAVEAARAVAPPVVAPEFVVTSLAGERVTMADLRVSKQPLLLLFVSPDCAPCKALLPDAARWQRDLKGQLQLAIISSGDGELNAATAEDHGLENVLLQEDREVQEAYGTLATPSAVLVSLDGTLAAPPAQGPEEVRALVARAVRHPDSVFTPCPNCGGRHSEPGNQPAAVNRVGEPAPQLANVDLDGNQVDLAEFRGSPTLVLFWNPACGFCQQMLPDLKEWEGNPPPGAPRLVVVSAGTAAANRDMGLRSPILLEPDFASGRALGARGTPSAVLVDGEGRIASPVAVGATSVMALARGGVTA